MSPILAPVDALTGLPPCRPFFPVRAPHRVVAAPRPLGEAPVVEVDDAWPSSVSLRLALLAADPARVRVVASTDPDGLSLALEAALALVPDLPLLPGVSAWISSVSGLARLADLVTLRQPADLVVLRRTGPGSLVAELLAVAFPSGWVPSSRGGATLPELHAPVAGNERLQRAAPALSEALLTKGPFLQYVWGLQPDSVLARDPSSPQWPPAVDPDGRWWLRVERQTTYPLPELGRALFFIRPTLTPVSSLSFSQRETLRESVLSMDAEALRYKGLSEGGLERFLRSLAS